MKKYCISALTARNRKYFTTVADLSKVFNCSGEVARRTPKEPHNDALELHPYIYQEDIRQMIEFYGTPDYAAICSWIHSLRLSSLLEVINALSCWFQIMDILGFFPWRVERISTLRSSSFSRIEVYPMSLSAIELQNK